MEAEIVDLGSVRKAREAARLRVIESFGRLPCPCCDTMTAASEMAAGQLRFVCDGGGSHEKSEWTWDGAGAVSDHNGRARMYFGY